VLLSALERSAFVIDHAELGGELMRRWHLPPDIVAAVRYHHNFEAAPPYEQLTAAVQAGDMIAHQLPGEEPANSSLLTSLAALWDILQLSPGDLPRLLAKAQNEVDKVKGMLEM
jgi:HD-like signal output (HDOD) protein